MTLLKYIGNGQVTIPKEYRDNNDDVIGFIYSETDGTITLKPVKEES
jgi:bifunctional DNA-binding transcriptional regulator/antitoxin component of YhaV-PrlF toxin-antitoxin module